MGVLDQILRHPIKSLGAEAVASVTLTPGRHMPWDRVWAIAHGNSAFDFDTRSWAPARNFVTVTRHPRLAQARIALDEATGAVTLSHPDRGEIRVRPDEGEAALAEWIAPLAERPASPPFRLARLREGALTDFPDTHLSIGNLASLRALEDMAGRKLSRERFRMNLWVDGFAPWEDLDWAELAVGDARLKITARDERCAATHANPDTGAQDVEVTRLLYDRFRHKDFGVYATVATGGVIRAGDAATAA